MKRPVALVEPKPRVALVPGSEVEEHAIVETMVHIRAILARTVARGLAELGEYLLATFYGGDTELVRSLNPRKHASLRKLQEKCGSIDLPVSFSTLARALRIAVLMRELPADSPFRLLPSSHQTELVKLDTREKIDLLALRAQQESYSVKRLRAAVQKAIPRQTSGRGRKPTPAMVKAMHRCMAALEETFDIEALDEAQREHVRERLESLRGRVEELEELLRR